MRQVAAKKKDFDERAGAVPFAVGLDRRRPPGVVDRGEPARGAGLVKRGRAGKGSGLAHEGLQVVVQLKPGAALGDQPLVPGDLLAAVVNDQFGGVEHRADTPADQPDRH
ncbi:hypothetical protein AB0K74_28020 [Streptomyces sp. NPDC056159]|uniref:hypothetical protein n=1 Tax=Streptomyces sp. NPDC056159 TaxID=3155537 RepID=UPI0034408AE4